MMLSKYAFQEHARFYRLLSRIYRAEVDEGLLSALKRLPTQENQPGWDTLRDYLDHAGADALTELAVDYAGLFLAAGKADGQAAVPCESLYTGCEGRLMGKTWEDVSRRYREAGLGRADGFRDLMEDHLALELEFMASMMETDRDNVPARLDFLQTHLLNWVPQFKDAVDRHAHTGFYKAFAQITLDFLKEEERLLTEKSTLAPSFSVRQERFADILAKLKEKYKVCAPKRFAGRGPGGSDLIRYGEIDALTDIVYKEKSHLSPKEIFYPVSQTMFRFTGDECAQEEVKDDRDILLFLRPCDLNAVERLDNIFLRNGQPDLYYARMREKCKFIMLECTQSFDNCFCVSMGTNVAHGYAAAVRIDDICALFEVCDEDLLPCFRDEVPIDFTPGFVRENKRKLDIPVIRDREELKKVVSHPYWDKYNDECIGCGGCNTGCPTCSCFDTVDVIYNETSRDGERRRVWSSCMLEDFTRTAGGARARKTPGANMRFKVLHKVYDYKLKFGVPMCVGCGRCVDRCPKKIDYIDTVNGLAETLRKERTENG